MRRIAFASIVLFTAHCGSTPVASVDDASVADASAADTSAADVLAEASTDAGSPDAADASVVKPIPCGQTFCRVDQTCNAGKCAFSCTGSTVPGDYATVQNAVDALAATGKDATICLDEHTYTEAQIIIKDPGAHKKSLTIIGLSMDRSKIAGDVYVLNQGGFGAVTFQGVHLAGGATSTALQLGDNPTTKVSLLACRLSGQTGVTSYDGELLVDGCDIAVGKGYGVESFNNGSLPAKVTVQNSYIHGCGAGVSAGTMGGNVNMDFRFLDDTVVGCGDGLSLSVDTSMTALYANSIFTGETVGVRRTGAGTQVTHGHNALWGNVSNYVGAADGPGYVKADCLLDTTGPAPALKPGSPCLGAGDPSVAPATDFYGVPRGAKADIGAVQSP